MLREPSRNSLIVALLLRLLVIHWMMTDVLVGANFRGSVFKASEAPRSRLLRTGFLPLGATVYASDATTTFTGFPLLKAHLVKVLTTSSLTPDQLLSRLHVKDADWAFAFDWFASTIVDRFVGLLVVLFELWSTSNGSVGEDGVEFIREKGELVLKMDWGLEDDDECIIDVLTLLAAHPSIHTGTVRAAANSNIVDITLATSNIELLANVALAVLTHLSVQHEHALITDSPGGGLEFIIRSRDEVSLTSLSSLAIHMLVNNDICRKWAIKLEVIARGFCLRLGLWNWSLSWSGSFTVGMGRRSRIDLLSALWRWGGIDSFTIVVGFKTGNKISFLPSTEEASSLEFVLEFKYGVRLPVNFFLCFILICLLYWSDLSRFTDISSFEASNKIGLFSSDGETTSREFGLELSDCVGSPIGLITVGLVGLNSLALGSHGGDAGY
jgi:hypothetical protein